MVKFYIAFVKSFCHTMPGNAAELLLARTIQIFGIPPLFMMDAAFLVQHLCCLECVMTFNP